MERQGRAVCGLAGIRHCLSLLVGAILLSGCLGGGSGDGEAEAPADDVVVFDADHLLVDPVTHQGLLWQVGEKSVTVLGHRGEVVARHAVDAGVADAIADEDADGFLVLDQGGQLKRLDDQGLRRSDHAGSADHQAAYASLEATGPYLGLRSESGLRVYARGAGLQQHLAIDMPFTHYRLVPEFDMLLVVLSPPGSDGSILRHFSLSSGKPVQDLAFRERVTALAAVAEEDRLLLGVGHRLQLLTLSDLGEVDQWDTGAVIGQILFQPFTGTAVLVPEASAPVRLLDLAEGRVDVLETAKAAEGMAALNLRHNALWQIDAEGVLRHTRLPAPAPAFDEIRPDRVSQADGAIRLEMDGGPFFDGAQLTIGEQEFMPGWQDHARLSLELPVDELDVIGTQAVRIGNPGPLEALSNVLSLIVEGLAPRVDGISPSAGPAGSLLRIRGARFSDNPAGNQVRIGGVAAVVAAASANELEVIVPLQTAGGVVQVTTDAGTAESPVAYSLLQRQAFRIAASEQRLVLPQSGSASIVLSLESLGLDDYDLPVALRLSGLPDDLGASLHPRQLSRNRDVHLQLHGETAAGDYTIRLLAEGESEEGLIRAQITLQLQVLDPSRTAVLGRVVHADSGVGLAGVRVSLGDATSYSDASGHYLFLDPEVRGEQVVLIDGDLLNTESEHYPSRIPLPVTVASGQTSQVLTAHLAPVQAEVFTRIRSGEAATVTDPAIPGYALNIPQGATMIGWDGEPIDRINVRQVHPDRLPIRPLPEGVTTNSVYLYYFFRPGGAEPSEPIPVTMQNDLGLQPGETATMWYYDELPEPDPESNQWRVMGSATVSADGQRIVSDPGVGIPRFCCGASFATPDDPPEIAPGGDGDDCPGPRAGNPVDLASGSGSVLADHDLRVGGDPALGVRVRYSSLSDRDGPFGRGTYSDFEWRLERGVAQATVTSPDGVRYNLVRQDDGRYRQQAGRSGGFRMELEVTGEAAILHRGTQRLRFGVGGQMDGLLLGVDDAQGQQRLRITRDPDESARVTRISDHQGRQYQLAYTGDQVTEIRCPMGRHQAFSYDEDRLVRVQDFGGGTTRYEWAAVDERQQIVRRVDPDGAVTEFDYLVPPPASEAPPGAAGNWSPQRVLGRIQSQTLADGAVYAFDYTPEWRDSVGTTRMTHPNNAVSEYQFSSDGYPIRKLDALGRVTEFDRDSRTGLLRTLTDPLGRITRFSHDQRGNVTSVTDPSGGTSLMQYHPRFHRPITVTDPLGRQTQLEYHSSGALQRLINPAGEATTLQRDSEGRLVGVINAAGDATHLAYDAYGNIRQITDPTGRSLLLEHDRAGRLLSRTDAAGRTTRYDYDAMDRLIQVADGSGHTTGISYTETGRIARVRDPAGNLVESNTFDLRGRLVRRVDALGGAYSDEHDLEGNLISATDARGKQTRIDYDLANRPVMIEYADGRTVHFTFDQADRLVRVVDSEAGEHRYAYDQADRLIRETNDHGSIEYAYDAAGQLLTRQVNGVLKTQYSYDAAGRVRQVEHDGRTVSFQQDLAGRLTEIRLPNGLRQTHAHDAAGQLRAIRYLDENGRELDRIDYDYDASGAPVRIDHEAGHPLLDTAFEAEYDEANRLMSLNGHALDYDANGNLIRRETDDGVVTFSWDARNQLVEIDGPDYRARFAYDYLGRRIRRDINGTVTRYIHDGPQVIAELGEERSIQAHYHLGLGIDEVLARYAGADEVLLRDALGSVMALSDEQGQIVRRYNYSAYGETESFGADSTNPLQFTGRENDGTGLYYYRARYYAPDLNRFISPDPIGLLAGDANFYRYVRNDPLRLVDPLGLTPNWVGPTGTVVGVTGGMMAVGSARRGYAPGFLLGISMVGVGLLMTSYSDVSLPYTEFRNLDRDEAFRELQRSLDDLQQIINESSFLGRGCR
ncbi:DUF6531 domain-containing protein [Methylonatrum kenyense]|uniref:RHS repeat-associated core domain-containing protein n=1 Tax=Methylonatrum kenyense TaxID=455253 RepID=UPI0020C1365A|nr:RHS repeat-associated core domain-containing protein [Methylonatrum kenyense]MCK8516932.1 DUF6531 domain-containing protein [Methylonatrum kenyense]